MNEEPQVHLAAIIIGIIVIVGVFLYPAVDGRETEYQRTTRTCKERYSETPLKDIPGECVWVFMPH